MRRCAGLWVTLFSVPLMAACLQGCTVPIIAYAEIVAHDELCRYANSRLPCPNDIVWRGTRSEFYRITGEVQYGDERIVYDQTVESKYKIGRRRDLDRITRIFEAGARIHDPYTLAHRLKDGSALLLRLPSADGLWDDLEGYDTGQYTAEEIARKFRPPDEFLPELSWVDDLETPTLKERYLSEAYYTQPNARLKIVRPFKLEFVPTSQEAEAVAAAQRAAAPKLAKKAEDHPELVALYALSPPQWSSHPEIADFLKTVPQAELSILPKDLKEIIRQIGIENRWGVPRYTQAGISQPTKYPDTKGMLFGADPEQYADAAIPLDCDVEARLCRPMLDARGYYRGEYAMKFTKGEFELAFPSGSAQGWLGRAIYVRSLDQIFYVSFTP